jgi:UDP-glucose 4-epimerase
MKIFVTGGAGYVGSMVADLLIRHGHTVTVYDNLERGHAEAVHSAATLVVGDLRDKEAVIQAVADSRPDAIMHFAAYAYVGESMEDPLKYFENNVSGSINLLQAARSSSVPKFVFSSSCATYGIPWSLPITEETPQVPVNPYGESKLIVERMLDWVRRIHGMDVVVLRYFNACGAAGGLGEDHSPETHIIPLILEAADDSSRVFNIYGDRYETGDGTCVRDYVHVKDLARAHLLALKPGLSAVLNLGSGRGFSVREMVNAAEKVTGKPIVARVTEARPGDPPVLIAESKKALSVLGWVPQHGDPEEIIGDAWRWFADNPRGYSK